MASGMKCLECGSSARIRSERHTSIGGEDHRGDRIEYVWHWQGGARPCQCQAKAEAALAEHEKRAPVRPADYWAKRAIIAQLSDKGLWCSEACIEAREAVEAYESAQFEHDASEPAPHAGYAPITVPEQCEVHGCTRDVAPRGAA